MTLLDLLDRPISFQRCFVDLTGSINGALMLSQAVYWSRRTSKDDGSFYKSRDEWQDETGLTHEQQEAVRRKLRTFPFWKERNDRITHRVWYTIDNVELKKCLSAIPVSPNRKVRFPQTVKHGSAKPVSTVSCNRTEITTEITTEEGEPSGKLKEAVDEDKKGRALFEDFKAYWNTTLGTHLPEIRLYSDKRAKAFATRIMNPEWRDHWKEAIDKIPSCPFLLGENDRKWKADAEFFLRPDTVAKIIEGKYDGPQEDPNNWWKKHY